MPATMSFNCLGRPQHARDPRWRKERDLSTTVLLMEQQVAVSAQACELLRFAVQERQDWLIGSGRRRRALPAGRGVGGERLPRPVQRL